MGWKDISYWLKGGIILFVISFLDAISNQVWFSSYCQVGSLANMPALCKILGYVRLFDNHFLSYGNFLGILFKSSSSILVYNLTLIISLTIIGIVVGFIIDKIKSRNVNEVKQ
jgi:hypothetical protein